MASWSEEETLKLIAIWSEDTIQSMLEGCKRNKDIYFEISKQMEAVVGYYKTADQCSSKIKKLKFQYRKIKDSNKKTGEDRKEWRFYDAMNDVLGEKPSTQPSIVIESSLLTDEDIDNTPDMNEEQVIDDSCSVATNDDIFDTSLDSSKKSHSYTPCNIEEQKVNAPPEKKTKKRKRSNDKYDKAELLIDKMIKLQEESEKNYIKLEERMMAIEEKRQKDNNEFMMHMMSFMFPPVQSTSQPMAIPPHPMYSYPPSMYNNSFIHSQSQLQDDNIDD